MKRRCAIFVGMCLSSFCVIVFITGLNRDDQILQYFDKYSINKFKELKKQACVHPDLSIWNDFDVRSVSNKNVTCGNADDEWVYTGNGKFYISSVAVKRYGEINCTYIPISNFNDNYKRLKPIYPMLNNSDLRTDAFKVLCKSANGSKYDNYHACISINKQPTANQSEISNENKFNVMILGLDSFSRQMFQRLLPKTHEYFTKTLHGSLLEGYNIVGDGTTRNLMPMFTGKRMTEIPEIRRGFPGARHVDEVLDFVWKKYENNSYVTQWAEDYPMAGAFFYRVLGFSKQPVTHYMRPFFLSVGNTMKHDYCIGERPSYKVYLDWIKEGLETNKGKPFFTLGFMARYSHDGYLQMPKIDNYNVEFLKYLYHKNILKNTFLILMSDHGRRFGYFRMTEQGKLEERQPYFGVFIPPKFRRKFPKRYRTFLENTKRLTVPSDIHETLLEIIGETGNHTNINRTIYSLFSQIPRERTCADAGIEPHWCACLKSETVSVSDPRAIRCVQHALHYINGQLRNFFLLCHKLSLKNILNSISFKIDSNVLKFKNSLDGNADFSDMLNAELEHYQITFETEPSSAIFEASFIMDMKTWDIKLHGESISRINKYNDAPKCIEKFRPDLRPYCYCRI
ncbi:uncharacterized protein LOC132756151 [Ruditapes philippinarum]|uniref:uncharacterized protein LOC132756151 n=1 Tax=Ruditapes philippinarum TaxID=129788 RepID=UPI00295A5CF6|nr:uncharacterized protein LOC132756151 [Ruditapes philippinarum]